MVTVVVMWSLGKLVATATEAIWPEAPRSDPGRKRVLRGRPHRGDAPDNITCIVADVGR